MPTGTGHTSGAVMVLAEDREGDGDKRRKFDAGEATGDDRALRMNGSIAKNCSSSNQKSRLLQEMGE